MDGVSEEKSKEAFREVLADMSESQKTAKRLGKGRGVSIFVYRRGNSLVVFEAVGTVEFFEGDPVRWLASSDGFGNLGLTFDRSGGGGAKWVVKVGFRNVFVGPVVYVASAVKLGFVSSSKALREYRGLGPDHLLVAWNATVSGPVRHTYARANIPFPKEHELFEEDDPESLLLLLGETGGVLLAPATWIADFLVPSPVPETRLEAKIGPATIKVSGGWAVYFTNERSNSALMPKQFVFLGYDAPVSAIAKAFDAEIEDERKLERGRKFAFASAEMRPTWEQRTRKREVLEADAILAEVVRIFRADFGEDAEKLRKLFAEIPAADPKSAARPSILIADDAPRNYIAAMKIRQAKARVSSAAKTFLDQAERTLLVKYQKGVTFTDF